MAVSDMDEAVVRAFVLLAYEQRQQAILVKRPARR